MTGRLTSGSIARPARGVRDKRDPAARLHPGRHDLPRVCALLHTGFPPRRVSSVIEDECAAEYADLVRAGVIDRTKVVRSALQNAASVAGLLLTTEAVISELPEGPTAARRSP